MIINIIRNINIHINSLVILNTNVTIIVINIIVVYVSKDNVYVICVVYMSSLSKYFSNFMLRMMFNACIMCCLYVIYVICIVIWFRKKKIEQENDHAKQSFRKKSV